MAYGIYTPRGASLKERLNLRSKPGPDGCRDFVGSTNAKGYGLLRVAGKCLLAHRVSYIEAHGPIADDVQILHTCDRPCCIEPRHLFPGNNTANVADRVAKGRSAVMQGETNPRAKLTTNSVYAILADVRPAQEIANEYNVSRGLVYAIRHRRVWKHLSRRQL